MKVTPAIKAKILKALRQQRKSREQLAEICGKKPSWASKLLSDGPTALQNIDDDNAVSIENFLGIQIIATAVRTDDGVISEVAAAFAKRVDGDDRFRKFVELVAELIPPPEAILTAPYVAPEDMGKFGEEIIRLATIHKEKPGKLARLVLELLEQKA